jgi:release factor glutamine methyltransferase
MFAGMKSGEAQRSLKEQLQAIYSKDEAAIITTMVLENITGYSKSELISKKDLSLTKDQIERLEQYKKRLETNEPVQYVLSTAWFYGMKLFVDKNVLIPRPETEELVNWIVSDVKAKGINVFDKHISDADLTTILKILDIGTGSGCIALALKKEMPLAEVWGCDISEEALNVARRNGSELDIRVDFQGIDFLDLDQQKLLPTVDIIVSNPPYIPAQHKEGMDPNVVNFEPHRAIFVPDNDALIFYKAIINLSAHRLYNGGKIYCEIHEDLGKPVVQLFKEAGFSKIDLRKDMQGKDRMIKVSAE